MGGAASFSTIVPASNEDPLERQRNSLIDEMLLNDQKEAREVVKILFLGPSDGGKTSFLKQLRLLYGNGFTERELRGAVDSVRCNTLTAMQAILAACKNLEIPLDSMRNRARATQIAQVPPDEATCDLYEDLHALWQDTGVQCGYSRRNNFRLQDSAKYFLDNLARTFAEDYMPTSEDYLQVSMRTTGVSEAELELGGVLYRLYDVGGQRGERKKWIHYFEDVTAVVFVAALSDYDQVPDCGPKNRLYEAMDLFEGIVNLPFFKRCHTMLYLNKADVFREKLDRVELGVHFPGYTGSAHFDEALHYMRELFFDRFIHPERTLAVHVTNATDANNVRWVWDETRKLLGKEPPVPAATPTVVSSSTSGSSSAPAATPRATAVPVSPRKQGWL